MEVLLEDRIMPTLYNSPSVQDRSEPVYLYGGLGDALLSEELRNLHTLITLELDDLTGLLILDESAVASKFLGEITVSYYDALGDASGRIYLLECLQELLCIVL